MFFVATLAFSMYSTVIEPLKLQLEDEIFTSYLPSKLQYKLQRFLQLICFVFETIDKVAPENSSI